MDGEERGERRRIKMLDEESATRLASSSIITSLSEAVEEIVQNCGPLLSFFFLFLLCLCLMCGMKSNRRRRNKHRDLSLHHVSLFRDQG